MNENEQQSDTRTVRVVKAITYILEGYNALGNNDDIQDFYRKRTQFITNETNYDNGNKNRLELDEINYALRCLREFTNVVLKNHLEKMTGKQILEKYGEEIINPKYMEEEQEKLKKLEDHKDLDTTLKEADMEKQVTLEEYNSELDK